MTTSKTVTRSYLLYLYIFLGALAAFPPLVTDMYLPTLPAMAEDYGATPSTIQLGLAMCILGLAAGQLMFGPLSDKYGRRPMLGAALVLFMASTIACIYSPTIEWFNMCRFFQGLGGAGGVVLSRSIATDCYSGKELAKTLAIIGAINGIAPVTAPVIGGAFAGAIGWKGIFWLLFGVGVLLTAVYMPFRESHPSERRHKGSLLNLAAQSASLLKNRAFMAYVLLFGLTNGVLFGYISSASFILQNDFGLSELSFGIVFAINSLGIVCGSMVSLKFRNLTFAIRTGSVAMLAFSVGEAVNHTLGGGMAGYEVLVFLILFCVGILFPSTTTLAMSEGKEMIGWASAFVGSTGFLVGGLVTPLVGMGDIQTSTFTALSVCSALAVILAFATRRKVEPAADSLT
ncbi:MAG: multidrug effflux MFS transporter [Muribaculaceae bacterium]|nr:multidrug effflux MFS transporter [Muribaculaceae bacterium]